jgi:hypothetical protein
MTLAIQLASVRPDALLVQAADSAHIGPFARMITALHPTMDGSPKDFQVDGPIR